MKGAEGEVGNNGIEDLVSAAATEATRKFTFEELCQLEDDYNFDWQCHEDTLHLLQKNETLWQREAKEIWLGWGGNP